MIDAITQDEMVSYLVNIDEETRQLYRAASYICLVTEDTLTEEFQIAASVVAVFETRVRQRKEFLAL